MNDWISQNPQFPPHLSQGGQGLAVGSLIKFGTYKVEASTALPIIWKVIGRNHTGYPANSVTLLANQIIDLRGFDAKEAGSADANRVANGNNRWKSSNLRQWLNSGGAASAWWAAQNLADGVTNTNNHDATPVDANIKYATTGYDDIAGFLSNFTAAELAEILDTTLTIARNTVTDTGATSETVVDKIFLLSNTEVGLGNENGIAEGMHFALFSSNAARIAYMTAQGFTNTLSADKPATVGTAWHWWLRTPRATDSCSALAIYTDGTLYMSGAALGLYGVRPALNLASGIWVSDSTDVDGCYTIRRWTAQCSENEASVSSEPAAGALWREQGSGNEVYTRNERYGVVFSNSGEQIFALNGLPVFAPFAVDSLWIKQARESEVWI